VGRLLASQPLAVLATQGEGHPYANLVAFTPSPDLASLSFATGRATRKYANLRAEPRVALLVDNRSNRESDFREAVAATATGVAEEVTGPERERIQEHYVSRHPHLAPFVSSPECALFRVRVETYVVVQEFQRVLTLRP
jgi:nitroimidazol reductase NimA-like FMN-containing flavoprotein (pyridoxamine 5'-phosphate oxidase superfamily)